MSREERIALQKEDRGDPEDTVYYLPAKVEEWGSREKTRGRVYHGRVDCPNIRQSGREPSAVTRAAAQRRWLAPCKFCILRSESEVPDEPPAPDKYDDSLLNELSDE